MYGYVDYVLLCMLVCMFSVCLYLYACVHNKSKQSLNQGILQED